MQNAASSFLYNSIEEKEKEKLCEIHIQACSL